MDCAFLRIGIRVGEHNILTPIDCTTLENGSEKCNGPVQDVAVEKIIPHPNYDSTKLINDIGLIKVNKMNLSIG